MLPILDFFYGIVPSYGLAIIALTLVIRLALFPVSANQLRGMRRMKIANPIMQQRIKEVQERYKSDPAKQQEEMAKVNAANFKEFGNPLSGCLPALLQMPVLFALFATLRGSPFADINYNINFKIFPQEQQAEVQPQAFVSPPQNIFFADRVHYPVQAAISAGTNLVVGEQAHINLQTPDGQPFDKLNREFPEIDLSPTWKVTKGEGQIEISPDGTIKALQPGDVTIQAIVPGLAADKGFLFIQALGKVGATNPDGSINWDILVMVLGFGVSLYINQLISGGPSNSNPDNPSQDTTNKMLPIVFSGMFLFFPLPSGVLLYMLIANIFQTFQAFLVSRESLPENLQKIADAMDKGGLKPQTAAIAAGKSESAKLPLKSKEEGSAKPSKIEVVSKDDTTVAPSKSAKVAGDDRKATPPSKAPVSKDDAAAKSSKTPPTKGDVSNKSSKTSVKPKGNDSSRGSLPFEPGSNKKKKN